MIPNRANECRKPRAIKVLPIVGSKPQFHTLVPYEADAYGRT
jgi:hypothetical protein